MRTLIPLTLAAILALGTAVARAETAIPQISVTGEGTVEAAPDMATISLGVTSLGATAAEAMAANSEAVATVIANLKGAGIQDRDIQTTGLSLNPNWTSYSSESQPKVDGYTAQNMVTVRVRALDTLGPVLDAAVKDGANTLNGLSFGVAEPRPLLDQARTRAVEDARRKAELLASAAGVTLGRVIAVTEGGGMMQPMPMFRAEASAAPPVAGGELGLTANVTVVWAIAE